MDWVRACKEDADDRVPSASDFSEAGPFNEMVVMGVLAVRLQNLNRELLWDGPNMRFTNIPDDATISAVIKDGFHIKDGHPTFDKTWTDPVNAQNSHRSSSSTPTATVGNCPTCRVNLRTRLSTQIKTTERI